MIQGLEAGAPVAGESGYEANGKQIGSRDSSVEQISTYIISIYDRTVI